MVMFLLRGCFIQYSHCVLFILLFCTHANYSYIEEDTLFNRKSYLYMLVIYISKKIFKRPKLLTEPTLTAALAAAVNLSDSEAAVSALSEFLLQKYENVRQAGAVFLEEEDFYADVKIVRSFGFFKTLFEKTV